MMAGAVEESLWEEVQALRGHVDFLRETLARAERELAASRGMSPDPPTRDNGRWLAPA